MSQVSRFEPFFKFSDILLDCSGFYVAPAHIRTAAIIIMIQVLCVCPSVCSSLYPNFKLAYSQRLSGPDDPGEPGRQQVKQTTTTTTTTT